MARPGTKPKPTLQVVREGNPGKRVVADNVVLPPSSLVEPTWSELFIGKRTEALRARKTASTLWQKLAPTLSRSAGLVAEQQEVLVDFCVTWARIEQGERAISRDGMIQTTERGYIRNPWSTVLNQYRAHMRSLIGELGLSPSAVTRLSRPENPDDDDPFD
jgi:P27 family predicted phage terminase small subunit